MLSGAWLALLAVLASSILAPGQPDWTTLGVISAGVVVSELLFRFAPNGWHGSLEGDRAIGLGTIEGAALLGVFTLLLPFWTTVVTAVVGGAAGAVLVEMRRHHDLSEDDAHEAYASAGRIVKRLLGVWLRVETAVILALWTVRSVMGVR